MTALTVNGSAAAATTLAAAGKLFNATGGTSGNTSTKVGSSTGRKQIFARGTSTNQTGAGSIPAPTDANFNGWMWDVTTLEGQRLASGTITPTFHLLASTGTTVTPTVEWYKRSSGGVYTQIATVAGSSIALTTSAQALTFTPPTGTQTDFVVGDKLVAWLWVNQTAGGATNSTISVVEATSASSAGVTSEAQAVTPGYAPIPVALSVTMAGTGALAFATYKQKTLGDSPLRYYRMNTASGSTETDLGSGGQNGTISGGVTLSQPGLVSDTDTAMLFNGSTGTISIPTTGLPSGASPFTLECWVQFPTVPTAAHYPVALNIGNGVNGQNAAFYFNGDSQQFSFGFQGLTDIFSSITVTANHIYYLLGAYDGTTGIFYCYDATAGTSDSISHAEAVNVTYGTAQIGENNGTLFFSGVIDEPAIYGSALPATIGGAHYVAGIAVLAMQTALSVTLAGTGTLSGTLSTSSGGIALTAQCDGVGTLAGTLAANTALGTTLTGAGVLSETLSANTSLSTTFAGVGTFTGTPDLSTALSTTFVGTGTLTETLSANTSLADTLAGIGTLSGVISLTTSLSVTLAGVGALAETLSAHTSLADTFAGVGQLSGTIQLATSLSATLVGVGVLSEALTATTSLASTVDGVGTLTGAFSLVTALADTFAGVGTLSGTPDLSTDLSTSMVGVGALTGTPDLSTALSANLAGVGALDGILSTSNTVAFVVTLSGVGQLSGTPDLSTTLAASLTGVGALSGTLDANGALVATLRGSGTLDGTISAQTALSTSMVGAGMLASTIMLSTSLATSLSGTGALSGAFSAQVALSLTFMGLSRLIGTLATGAPGTSGTATILDQLVAFALLGDGLVSIAGVSDRLVAVSIINDALLAVSTINAQSVALSLLSDELG